MKLAFYIKDKNLREDSRLRSLVADLESFEPYEIDSESDLRPGTGMLLSIGGDGTFLIASRMVAGSGMPVLGVNFGRLGFLSEDSPADVVNALNTGEYEIEERHMLSVKVDGKEEGIALNEVAVSRHGAAVLGIDVTLNGQALPTYWADGLLVATSSGSTAYSLSVGGPVCTPDADVLIIAPIAPHNLNVRPLIVPSNTGIRLSLRSRDEDATLTLDNDFRHIDRESVLEVGVARFSLKRVRLGRSNFIGALKDKLLWGEDVRNGSGK